MEILGGGPDDADELRLDRDERSRQPDSKARAGERRRPVAASLDLGTMELAPGTPATYGRPVAPAPTPAPHAAPAPVLARPGAARPAPHDEEWAAVGAAGRGPAEAAGAGGRPGDVRLPGDGRAVGVDGGPDGAVGGNPDDVGDAAENSAWRESGEHAVHDRDYRADLAGAVFSSPSLALAGLGISLAGLTGGAPVMLLYAELSSGPADTAPKLIAKALTAVALLSAVLAFSSLRRMRAVTPRWVATAAGATLLIALVMLVTAGYFWWTASTLPAIEGSIE